jgi:RNA polymerase sigma factor (TIGR02999 family)
VQGTSDITELLAAYTEGEREALDQLMPIVYERLRRMAQARMRGEREDHTLTTTGLVHEAFLKLVDINRIEFDGRAHFYAVASRVMRRILIDYAERRRAQKRGGGVPHDSLHEERIVSDEHAEQLLDLEDALQRLEKEHPRPAEVVAHHYFGGLTQQETALAMGISVSTAERDLRFSRAWLSREWSQSPI